MDKLNKIFRINFNTRRKNKLNLPILYVRFSCKHVYTQLIHDGKIIFDISSLNQNIFNSEVKSYNIKGAIAIGELCGKKILEKGFSNYVFNRGDRKYIGTVKELGDAVSRIVKGGN